MKRMVENVSRKMPVEMPDSIEMVVMHMSGAYFAQDFYCEAEYLTVESRKWRRENETLKMWEIDCRDIEGTRGYCDQEAKERLRDRIRNISFQGIHFLDSGNYHYLSLLWMEKIQEPFSLVLFDHHPDMQRPAFGDITSCGGWVREALLHNLFLDQVYLIGVNPVFLEQEGILNGITASGDETDFPVDRVHVKLSGLWEADREREVRRQVYLSIDKDVLRRQEARCDWDQGEMTMQELFFLLDQIASHCRILGVDICGESPDAEENEDTLINNKTNRRFAQKLPKYLRKL